MYSQIHRIKFIHVNPYNVLIILIYKYTNINICISSQTQHLPLLTHFGEIYKRYSVKL